MSAAQDLRLIAITDAQRFGEAVVLERWQALAQAAAPGTVAIDLREPGLSARALLSFGERLVEVAQRCSQLFLVNDRVDVALALGADGVHLREGSVDATQVRRLLGRPLIVRACHAVERVAEVDADIVLLSPILQARKGNPALGLAALGEAFARLRVGRRLFALGGVEAENAPACLGAGAAGVAAITGVFSAVDQRPLLRALNIARGGSNE